MGIAPPDFQTITPDALGNEASSIPDYMTNYFHIDNTFKQATAECLTGNLVIGTHISGMVYPASGYLSYKTSTTYSTQNTFAPISFGWTGLKNPAEVRMGIIRRQDNKLMTLPVQPFWNATQVNGQVTITINYITGLADNTSYYFTMVCQ